MGGVPAPGHRASERRGAGCHREKTAGNRQILEEGRAFRADSQLVMEDRCSHHAEDGKRSGSVANAPTNHDRKTSSEFQGNDSGQEKCRHTELGHVVQNVWTQNRDATSLRRVRLILNMYGRGKRLGTTMGHAARSIGVSWIRRTAFVTAERSNHLSTFAILRNPSFRRCVSSMQPSR